MRNRFLKISQRFLISLKIPLTYCYRKEKVHLICMQHWYLVHWKLLGTLDYIGWDFMKKILSILSDFLLLEKMTQKSLAIMQNFLIEFDRIYSNIQTKDNLTNLVFWWIYMNEELKFWKSAKLLFSSQ